MRRNDEKYYDGRGNWMPQSGRTEEAKRRHDTTRHEHEVSPIEKRQW